MSGGLAPSKSTVYVSNLPYDLSNNDIHKLFEKHGRIIKVTVLRERETRKSKGVAFLLFLNREDAKKCVDDTNMKEVELFGRTLKASIAKDNGRSTEFIRRKDYPNKMQCYECGEFGHISYKCSRNLLGDRDAPTKKIRKRKKKAKEDECYKSSEEDEDCETLSAAIASEQEKSELETYRYKVATGDYSKSCEDGDEVLQKRKKIKKSSYFSDEEESD